MIQNNEKQYNIVIIEKYEKWTLVKRATFW